MNAPQKLMRAILEKAKEYNEEISIPELTSENIESVYDDLDENDCGAIQDAREEIRCSGIETGLPAEFSRHYECDKVAARMSDGSWIGWNYWHGGGKHGEPSAIDWIDSAVDLIATEKTVISYDFKVTGKTK